MKLKSVYLGLLLALALILSYVETLIPFSVAIPGIKIGMSNLTVIWCLYLLSFREAMLLSVSKAILSGLLFGNPVMILYSLSGAVLSCLVMYILKRSNGFHVPVVSAVGGVAHNIGQLLVAFFMVQTYGIVYYIPFLLLAGLLMGGVNGSISLPAKLFIQRRFLMIAFVNGIVEDYSEEAVILDVNGIGYEIKISGDTAAALPSIGERMKLYTYTYVREDAFCLYGFLTKDDLEIFKKLITVSGIGPKGGLAVLSVMSADDLRFAIMSGDARMIATAPGIGKKTAERVILDLRDKISMEDTMIHRRMTEQTAQDSFADDNQIRTEAVEALTALGYSAQEALQAVKKVVISEEMDVEAVLKAALKNMF